MKEQLILKDVCVILVNYNGWQDTCECVDSLRQLDEGLQNIIIVDNCSLDDSVRQLKSKFKLDKAVVLIENDKNEGFSAGNNVGIRFALTNASCAYVWLLNNDTVVDVNAMQVMKSAFKQDKYLGVAGSVLCEYSDRAKIQAVGGVLNLWSFHYKTIGAGECLEQYSFPVERNKIDVCGASFMMSRAYLEQIGFLDERYFLYCEEMDIGEKSRRGGWHVYPIPGSIVYHKGSSSIGKKHSTFKDYHVVRSKMIFVRKFYPKRLLLAFLVDVLVRTFLRLFNLKFANIRGIFQGLRDGVREKVS